MSPDALAFLLPASVVPLLSVIAKIGVILFMFLVGLELDLGKLRGSAGPTVAISHASIVAPFLLGAAAALALYPVYAEPAVGFTAFSLFIGVSLSVTAFPVLARILTDRRVERTRLGTLALACAAVGDATAWVLLAAVAGVASAAVVGIGWTLLGVAAYSLVMAVAVRPAAGWFARRQERVEGPLGYGPQGVVFVALLLSAAATEAVGIHALFGAFLFGAILPHDSRLAAELRVRVNDIVVVLFLPTFFAFTGLRTQIGLLDSTRDWLVCAAIVGIATIGKFGGSFVAARFSGIGLREAAALGILMNTRGLMELVVLNVGLDLGVITPTLFAMLVLMALVTTVATTPILDLVLARRGFADAPDPNAIPERA
jgi:Kef-type K+ transport system membrane component KefB